MMKITTILLGLVCTSFAFADISEFPKEVLSHKVTLVGLKPGEGRYIRSDLFENNKFQSGYYFCAGTNSVLYDLEYFLSKSDVPFHAEHLIKFSICQDETMAHCQEIATDKYLTFRSIDGFLKNDVTQIVVDVSPLQATYPNCEPNTAVGELVRKSIYEDQRRFTHVG